MTKNKDNERHQLSRNGFTLVELSVSLVIIALLVAGVLVGREMIVNAEIRQYQNKVSKFDSAVLTFKLKYDGMPGDLPNAFSFFGGDIGCTNNAPTYPRGINGSPAGCNGNGNGNIDYAYESMRFWQELQDAGLISENIQLIANLNTVSAALAGTALPVGYLPVGPRNAVWKIWCVDINNPFECTAWYGALTARHHYNIGSTNEAGAGIGYDGYRGGSITPNEARGWDTKMDDGISFSGKITATSGQNTGTFGVCASPTATNDYGFWPSDVNKRGCWMFVGASGY